MNLFSFHYLLLRRRQWQPTPVLLPGESHRQRSRAGYCPWNLRESDTTVQLTLSLSLPTTTYMTQAVGYTPLPTLLFYPLLFEHIVWFRPDVEVMALQIMGCIRADGLSFHLWMSGTYFSAWHRVICWTNKCMLYTCYHLMFIFSNSFYDGNLYLWI